MAPLFAREVLVSTAVSFWENRLHTQLEKIGKVLYSSIAVVEGKERSFKEFTFKVTIQDGTKKLPNDDYSIWVSAELKNGNTIWLYCPPVQEAKVDKGQEKQDTKGNISLQVTTPLVQETKGKGTYSVTSIGWQVAKEDVLIVYALPSEGGAISRWTPALDPKKETYQFESEQAPTTYKVISVLRLENKETGELQHVTSEFQDLVVTRKKDP